MSRSKPILTAQHILEKEFRVDTKGYRMTEVDIFLDAVNSDYKLYEEKISRLIKELNEERTKCLIQEKEIEKLNARLEITAENAGVDSATSVDLLKRLSELEKKVYK